MADRPPGPEAGVLGVVTSTDRRGAEVAAVQLGDALVDRGLAVTTVALWPGQGPARLDLPVLGRRRHDPAALAALVNRTRQARVLVGHGSSTLPFGAAAAVAARTPFVYRSIGDPAFWGTTRARRARVGVALRRARRVVALWPGAADTLADWYGLARERLSVIPTGVPTAAFGPTAPEDRPTARRALVRTLAGQPDAAGLLHVAGPGGAIDPDRPLIAYLGALADEKEPRLAVGAMAQLPGAQLVVAGAGPQRDRLAQLAARVAPGRVHLVGALADPAGLLAAADVLVLPSRSEGIPAVAIEAGLSGLPVVARRVGGVPEVVVDGRTGVLVDDPRPAALATGLAAVVGVDGPTPLGLELGRAGRARCLERFALEVVAGQWADLLADVTGTV